MHTVDPRALNLADFYGGHDTDPLEASAEFVEWARATSREQGLFQQPLAAAAGPRTRLVVDGREREFINLASLDSLVSIRNPPSRPRLPALLNGGAWVPAESPC